MAHKKFTNFAKFQICLSKNRTNSIVQACPLGYAVFGIQVRKQVTTGSCLFTDQDTGTCVAPKDGTGITGLRLFCSQLETHVHKNTEKILEFPGSTGDWGKKLTCKENHWVTSFHVRYAIETVPETEFDETIEEHLGVVQMMIACSVVAGTGQSQRPDFEGTVFPFGQDSGTPGRLETENPTIWQQGLSEYNLKPWHSAIVCPQFIKGARVETDQNNERLSRLPQDMMANRYKEDDEAYCHQCHHDNVTIADLVGINDIKFTCDIYSEFYICTYIHELYK